MSLKMTLCWWDCSSLIPDLLCKNSLDLARPAARTQGSEKSPDFPTDSGQMIRNDHYIENKNNMQFFIEVSCSLGQIYYLEGKICTNYIHSLGFNNLWQDLWKSSVRGRHANREF